MAVSGRTRTGARPSIKIQPIDFDHRRCVLAGLRLDVFDDIVDDRGRRENDRRCGIGEHGNGALVVGTTLGIESGTATIPACSEAIKLTT